MLKDSTTTAAGEDKAPEELERRGQVRGLVLLAIAAIIFAIARTGFHTVFAPGWWRF